MGWRDLRWPGTPLRGRSRRSWLLDAFLAALVPLVSLIEVNPPGLVLALAMGGVLLFRRVWPVPANLLALILGLATLGSGSNVGLMIAGSLVAVHTLASRCSLRMAITGFLISQMWIIALAVAVHSTFTNKLLLLVVLSTPQVIAFLLGLYRQSRDRFQVQLQERNRLLEVEREQRDLIAAADERARIAREMHDLIAHHLTVVVALSEGLARSGEITSERSRQAITVTASMARQALEETRRLLGDIPHDGDPAVRRPVPDLGALEGLISQVRATGLPVTLEVTGDDPNTDRVPSGLQLTVFRLVQEALTNTMKHADRVTRATVLLHYGYRTIEVSIEDDGEGRGGTTSSDGLGRGIVGMTQRVQSFGGILSAGPCPGGGWRVGASFPLTARSEVEQ